MIVSARLRVEFDVAGDRVVYPTKLLAAVPYAVATEVSEPTSAQQTLGGEVAASPDIQLLRFELNYGEVLKLRKRLSVRFSVRSTTRAAVRVSFDVMEPGQRFRRRGMQLVTAVPVPGAVPSGNWSYSVVAGTGRIAVGAFSIGPAMGVELRWPTLGFSMFTVYGAKDGGPEVAIGYPTEGVFRHAA